MKLTPARFDPIFLPRIWGTRSLAPLFPQAPAGTEPIGEVWLTGNDSSFATGPFAGRKVAEGWAAMPEEWRGTRLRDLRVFPLLVKFIFPEAKLSVQVHPPDDYAARHEAEQGGIGKTEMWYAVSARAGAEVMVGLKPGVTRESFCRAIAEGTTEDCLEHLPLRAGDAIFLPAGTAHTVGPGSVLCEIQENSDLTYRVYDYNRVGADGKLRPLHVEKALEVIQFGEQSGGRVEPVRLRRGPVEETYFIACRYFATEKWAFAERIAAVTSRERFELLILLAGQGRLTGGGDAVEYSPAQVWLLPAALGAYQLEPASPTTLLRAYVPDLDDFVQRLTEQRVEPADWARLVFP